MSDAEKAEIVKGMTIQSWLPHEAPSLFANLESPNWAPWLAASQQTLAGRAKTFPSGQLLMKDKQGKFAASLSLNQIDWDGANDTLPSWDDVAGTPTDYSKTYRSHGNTLALLSMNVAPIYKGLQLPSKMIDAAKDVAKMLGVLHLVGSFRPSGYGQAKRDMGYDLDFDTYCQSKQGASGRPIDPWLRSLSWKGVELFKIDTKAMVIDEDMSTFTRYKSTYRPQAWYLASPNIWECGEVGKWSIDEQKGKATYQESNYWGRLPVT